jgi:hypothetical protein
MRTSIVIAIVVALGLSAAAQQQTLREQVNTLRRDVSITVTGSHLKFDFDRVLRGTDIVVRAIVGRAETYLSEDGTDIYTTHELINPDVQFAVKAPTTALPSNLRAPLAFALTQRGGAISIDGFIASVKDADTVPLTYGMDVVVFLQEHAKRYWLSDSYAVFQVQDGAVVPLSRRSDGNNDSFAGMAVQTFLADVVSRRSQLATK